MSSFVLDANMVSFVLDGNRNVNYRFREALTAGDSILGCPVVWHEIRRGLLARDAKRQLDHFEALFGNFVWQDLNRNDWMLASTLWKERRDLGLPIGDADLLIGSFTRNRNAILVTDNEKDFTALGIIIENWTKPSKP